MSTTFANQINNLDIYAARAVADKDGNQLDTTYAKSADLATVATSGDYNDLSNKPAIPVDKLYIATYGTTTLAEITAAINAGKHVFTTLPNLPGVGLVFDGTIFPITLHEANSQALFNGTVTDGNGTTVSEVKVKVDSTDTWTIDALGLAQSSSLATVATTGDYDDLSNKPTIPAAQVNADWNAASGVAEILNKPANLVQDANYVHTDENFTSADKSKLTGIAAGAEVNVQADWNEADSTSDAYIQNKPTIPAAQVNADWNAASGVAEILNKPTFATVATTGDYDDLSNKPTIRNVPASTSSDEGEVLTVNSQGEPTWTTPPGLFYALYGISTYADILDAVSNGKVVYCIVSPGMGTTRLAFLAYKGANNLEFQYYRSISPHSAATQGDEVYVYKVDANGWTTTTRKAYTQVIAGTHMSQSYSGGTLTLNAAWPTIDQTYDGTSTNAQSGAAVAGALATKEDAFDVGTGLEMDTSGTTPTLQVEAPVDIVAGPGIVIDNPDGNTLRVSQQYPTDETVLWGGSTTGSDGNITLSESMTNFERIGIFFSIGSAYEQGTYWYGGKWQFFETGDLTITKKFCISDNMNNGNDATTLNFKNQSYTVSNDNLTFTLVRSTQLYYNGSSWAVSTTAKSKIYKVVGIHRIAGGN